MSYSVRTEDGTDQFGKNKYSISIVIMYNQRTHAPDEIMRVGLHHWLDAYDASMRGVATLDDLWKWTGEQPALGGPGYQTTFLYTGKSDEAKSWAKRCDIEVRRGVWLVDLAYDVLYAANLEGNRLNSTVLSDKKSATLLAEQQVREPAIVGLPIFLDEYRKGSVPTVASTIPAVAEVVHNAQ